MEHERRPRRGHDPAADREDPVHVPDRLLEVPAVDRVHGRDQEVAHRVASEVALVLGEAVLEQLRHRGLRLSERREAVADVPDGCDSELLAEAPRGTPVVGDRDDRGDVRGVLLEPAKERGKAGAAPDRHHPGTPGQEPTAVYEVDEGLLAALRERAEQGTDDADRPVPEEEDPQPQEYRRADPVRQELEGDERDRPSQRAVDLDIPVQLSQCERTGEGERGQAHERDAEPALDPDPRPQPAAQVHAGLTRAPARGGRC